MKTNSYSRYGKNLWMFLFLAVLVFAVPQHGEDLKDKPDSIRYMMGINVDDSIIEELSGEDVYIFTLYTTSKKSAITWKMQKGYYLYTLTGDDHELKAFQLIGLLRANGLKTFVAERTGKNLKFNKYHRVIALQVGAIKQAKQ